MVVREIELRSRIPYAEVKPYEHHTKYYETDQRGVIHHTNYIKWMEAARMNLMEQMGFSYKQMEEMEIICPVVSVGIDYVSAVRFNEVVIIEPKLIQYDGSRMELAYDMYDRETGEKRAIGHSSHCFLTKAGIPISLGRIYPELDTRFFEFRDSEE